MKHGISINLFGHFEVRLEGVPVRMPTRKVELILALMSLEPGVALSRSTLAGLIWPGQPDAQARASLRQAIFRLRTALEPSDALEVTSGWIRLRRDRLERDIDVLDTGAAADGLPSGTPLEGMNGFEAEIEERLDGARSELRARLIHWLETAEASALEARRFTELETLARRHLLLDGYDEGALRMLMTALWRQGRRNAALDLFHDASRRILADLSVPVEPATTALFHEIRAHPTAVSEARHIPAPAVTPVAPDGSDAEADIPHLRHLAVMHVVSDRLLAALRNRDPEDAEAAGRAACAAIERIVRREGGRIAGRAGHRLSCIFGADRPDESPSLSAALAAFDIARMDCAIGIDAGRALIGGETQAYPAAHLAEQLSEDAGTGEVRLTGRVAKACLGAFTLERIDAAGPDDVSEEETWRLSGEILSRGGFDIRKARGLSPFVGREAEMGALLSLSATEGPRAIAATGEAGIGKSRLVHEFLSGAGRERILRVQFLPSETGGGIGRFAPVIEALFEGGMVGPGHSLETAIPDDGLRRRIAPAEAVLSGHAPSGTEANAPRGPRLQAIAEALLLAAQLGAGRDAVLLVEDAHWADEDGALLLERMLRSLDPGCPLVIVTSRPGRGLDFAGIPGLRRVDLGPLAETEAIRLLALLDRDDPAGIVSRAGGVPLFLEEVARAGGQADPPGSPSVPETLAGLLSRRIDALPAHLRRMIEAAAVIGAEPSDDLLRPLSDLGAEAYDAAVAELADGDLLFRIRSVPRRVYGFKHALVQEAAYQAIPTRRRKYLHARVVELCEPDWRAGDESLGAMLARHALASGDYAKAVAFALSATEQAVAQSYYPLADRMLTIASEAVQSLPPSPETKRAEARILKSRRPVSWLLSKDDIEAGLERSETLAVELGDDGLLADVCVHRAYLHSDDGQLRKALAYCERAEQAARRAGLAEFEAEAALARCQALSLHGHMRAAIAAACPCLGTWRNRRSERGEFIVTRFVMLQFLLARSEASIGNGTEALVSLRDATAAALATGRPVDRYMALRGLAEVLGFAGQTGMSATVFEATVRYAREAELDTYASWSEADLLALRLSPDHADARANRARLETVAEARLYPIARLKARIALARTDPNGGIPALRALLRECKRLDLDLLRFEILGDLSARGVPGADADRRAIQEEQGYAPCAIEPAEVRDLLTLLECGVEI
ncbi:AAA family ATPase [Rhodobacterales bacterium HKCCE2091]|nr:AAA family ATPase [Rhodobacterales bacterium HKCCE2091]